MEHNKMVVESILRKIDYLDDTKQKIKTSLNSKGVTIADSDPFSSYASKIDKAEKSNTTIGLNEGETKLDYLSSIKEIDMTGWNTTGYSNFSYFFRFMSGLVSVDLTPLNLEYADNLDSMFMGCTRLKTLNLTKLGTSTYNYSSIKMFKDCTSLETVIWPNQWKSNLEINQCPLTKETIISLFNSLVNRSGTLTISSSQNNMLSESEKDIARNKGWTLTVV